jgi:nucleoside-diphosphate-sugar epimerase
MARGRSVLIVGFGDVGSRVAAQLKSKVGYRVHALIRKGSSFAPLAEKPIRALRGDLDRREALTRLLRAHPHGFDWIFHFAPPPSKGRIDTRTANLLAALDATASTHRAGILACTRRTRLVYISTTGVYGDCEGRWIDENDPLRARTARAKRRVGAESRLIAWGRLQRQRGVRVSILRAPGIVSSLRPPVLRVERQTPVLVESDDVYVNHIHADDLAFAAIAAARYARAGRIFNAVCDEPVLMGDYFDRVARAAQLPVPPRVTRERAGTLLSAVSLSFMGESRRIGNARIKRELRLRWHYADVNALIDATQPQRHSE